MNKEPERMEVGDSLEALVGRFKTPAKTALTDNSKEPPVGTSPAPLKTIKITKLVLERIFLMAEAVAQVFNRPLEVYALCYGNEGIIEGILIPKQTVNYISIDIEEKNILSIADEVRGKNLTILGWVHSHADFSVFFSSVDRRNQETLLHETTNYIIQDQMRIKYVYGMTVNIHHDVYGVVSTQFSDARIANENATFEISGGLPELWDRNIEQVAIKRELEEKLSIYRTKQKILQQNEPDRFQDGFIALKEKKEQEPDD